MPDQIAPHHGPGATNPPGTMDVDTLPLCQRSIDGIKGAPHQGGGWHIPIADGQPLAASWLLPIWKTS
jgi:hypothetical protein